MEKLAMKELKHTMDLENYIVNDLKSDEDIKLYLNASLKDYLEDGDFNSFYRALEIVIKAKDSISGFAKKVGMSRTHLYSIFKSEKEPKFSTIVKIFQELGYELEIA
jgi:probable addiction module antidote protein